MRPSSAVLTDTSVRLWDLVFPASQVLMARTRAAYVHLDNLIAYSKRDRDAKVDAFLACYRPDETVLLFFLRGDLVNAAVFAPIGRFPIAISEALKHIRAEPERAEIAFHEGTAELLAAIYATCVQTPEPLGVDPANPDALFRSLAERRWNGVLELISGGRVNYVTVRDGRFANGVFAERRDTDDPRAALARIFKPTPPEVLPKVTARAIPGLAAVPAQATPALVQVFRQFVWDVVDAAEREVPGEGTKRAERVRAKLAAQHDALRSVGGARGSPSADPICEPGHLADAVGALMREFLGELEITHPGIATRLVKDAGREQRFALGAVGFFERLPWRIDW
jgi:hypothetical protein